MNNKRQFDMYRYQILPLSRKEQFSLFEDYGNIDALIARKNEILEKCLLEVNFTYSRAETTFRKWRIGDDDFVFRIGVDRPIKRTTKDFTEEKLDSWPSIHIIFQNDPSVQKLFIEVNKKVFQKTSMVATKIVENSINRLLKNYNLVLHIEPIFEKDDFWKIVREYEGKITWVKFNLVTPNMSNISGALSEDLKELAKSTNTTISNMKLNSNIGSALDLDEGNNILSGLVEYASQGAGNISIKVKGLKAIKSTKDCMRSVEIEEVDINSERIKSLMSFADD